MSAFRAALRISRRAAWRSKRRSALILAMIALPVIVVTCLAVNFSAMAVRGDMESFSLGRADAAVWGTEEPVEPTKDSSGEEVFPNPRQKTFTNDEITRVLDKVTGPGVRVVPVSQGRLRYLTPQGYVSGWVNQIDLRDPLAQGTYRLLEGRLPAAPGEVVASVNVRDMGGTPGATLYATAKRLPLRVVGVALLDSATVWPDFVAFPGSLPISVLTSFDETTQAGWLVDAPRPVTMPDIRALNARDLVVDSRAVPGGPFWPDKWSTTTVSDDGVLTTVPWIGLMLLEVVLLAGPAFAVGGRRRAREFALVAAQGGAPRQLWTIALADGLLFGVTAAVAGAAAGIGAAAVTLPRFELSQGYVAGPHTIPWGTVAMIAALGVVAGLLAALAPAARASRTDAAAVLAGRREPGRDRVGRPVLGLVLIIAGVTATVVSSGHGVSWIAAAALLTQLGLVAVVPSLITLTSRSARLLPLPLRFAVRDAARNRARTAPAVAAVMTAVVVLTALGVALESRMAQGPQDGFDYPQGPTGALWIRSETLSPQLWDRMRAAVRADLPAGVPIVEGHTIVSPSGVPFDVDVPDPDQEAMKWNMVDFSGPGGLLVGDARLLRYVLGRDDPAAVAALRAGKVVVLDPRAVRHGEITMDVSSGDDTVMIPDKDLSLPAIGVKATGEGWAQAVVAPETVRKKGYATATALLAVDPADFRMPEATARRVAADVGAISSQVEMRWERPGTYDDRGLLIALSVAAAVLVLGMTFIATLLAAVEARQDLETMSAVGAAPRVKRAVVAAQALVIALLGSAAGVLAGLVPGVAASYGMVSSPRRVLGADGILLAPHPVTTVVAIPWALIAVLIVGLPLMAALGGALLTRSRLPRLRRRPV